MKKVLSIILIFALMCVFAAGCGRRGASALGLNSKKSSQKEQIAPNNNVKNNKDNIKTSTGSDSTESTNSKLQETSNLMDKLDSTLNGLDNSADITTTESIINNIN